jgi:hypothetical protein
MEVFTAVTLAVAMYSARGGAIDDLARRDPT